MRSGYKSTLNSMRLVLAVGFGWLMLTAAPALAEVDLTGNWANRVHEDYEERWPGPELVNYMGIPLNDAARARALSYPTATLSIPQRQCLYYPPFYMLLGPQDLKLWADADPVTGRIVAWNTNAIIDRAGMKIWMDDRPHPGPQALHTNVGFSTGKWEGDTLVVHLTHIKEGFVRRNGVPSSDQATVTLYFTPHDDLLSVTAIIEDPFFLTEPYVRTGIWKHDPKHLVAPTPNTCLPADELAELSNYEVPHYLPGKNPFVNDWTKKYNLPLDAVLGGSKTMYPEYRQKIKADGYAPPANSCKDYCCGWGGPRGNATILLHCALGP